MPYEIRKENDKYCAYNPDTDKKEGCKDSLKEIASFVRELLSLKNDDKKEVERMVYKSFDDFYAVNPEERPETKDEEKSIYGSVHYTWATSYDQLDAEVEARDTAIETNELLATFPMLAENIIIDPDITNKKSAIKKLGGELADRIEAAGKSSKELDRVSRINGALTKLKNLISPSKDDNDSMMLWKEADGYHWIVRYSNKFRDRDNPPEIISEKSHRRFIEMVDKGQAPYPELWLWHVPDWKIGQADWLAYDDTGFAVASGTIDKGKEPVAEWLMEQKDFLVSHGMPNESIAREDKDPTVIIEHETREISLLPGDVAANTMTGFVINKESDMTIPTEKRDALVSQWKLADGLLNELEASNKVEAEKATEEGVESKEKEAETETVVEAKVEVEEEETEDETKENATEEETETVEDPLTRAEVAKAITSVFTPILDGIDGRMETLEKAVVQILKTDEKKIKETISNTPAASLAVLLQKGIVGDEDALVKDGDGVGDLAPEENEEEVEPVLGIPFIDRMLTPKK